MQIITYPYGPLSHAISKKKQCVPKAIFPAGVIVGLRVQSSFGNRSKGRSRLDPIGPDGELVIGPLILGSGRVGRRGGGGGEELVGIKEIIPPPPFYSSGPFSSGLNIRTLLARSPILQD